MPVVPVVAVVPVVPVVTVVTVVAVVPVVVFSYIACNFAWCNVLAGYVFCMCTCICAPQCS